MNTTADGAREDDPVLVAVYSPSKRQIGCVIVAAMFGADRRVNSIVSAEDWFTSPVDDMTVLSGTRQEWRTFAAMAPEERPGPECFEKGRRT